MGTSPYPLPRRVANRGNRHLAGTWTQELSLLYQMNSDALDSLKADGVVWETPGGEMKVYRESFGWKAWRLI